MSRGVLGRTKRIGLRHLEILSTSARMLGISIGMLGTFILDADCYISQWYLGGLSWNQAWSKQKLKFRPTL